MHKPRTYQKDKAALDALKARQLARSRIEDRWMLRELGLPVTAR